TTPTQTEPAAASRARPVTTAALERLSSIPERVPARPAAAALEQAPAKKEADRWTATTVVEESKVEVATPKALKKALEH
ncbi:DNA polymerase III subunit gamma/tau, partial [Klebsiella pneumoniae]|nr:DNA polymerase III subunit gamma/tau [Klebsiella pneumoniae]